MIKNELEQTAAEIAETEKKQWVTPAATTEKVSDVTMGVQGGAGDGFNSCHS